MLDVLNFLNKQKKTIEKTSKDLDNAKEVLKKSEKLVEKRNETLELLKNMEK